MTPQGAIRLVARTMCIPAEDILGKSRVQHTVTARHITTWLLHRKLGLSLNQTADVLNRDHAAVHHSCKVVDSWLEDRWAYPPGWWHAGRVINRFNRDI
ncbi:MAG: hypothetical protein IJT30_03285 [Muribaculaceae bacterium]|nr:hypothetical protein [Muribaculaceae bacterium]